MPLVEDLNGKGTLSDPTLSPASLILTDTTIKSLLVRTLMKMMNSGGWSWTGLGIRGGAAAGGSGISSRL
ncbi:hypothetical protein Tsubulata_033112 [Turnera subulata]|uniref:Uncharacterized protein n=1 Tax=Turnera subulata TaxID=218843 RepID=A0A9Q0J550_9ROSI|nr:hypothetical protein Tsubulata_033112 [Turnera subulata]